MTALLEASLTWKIEPLTDNPNLYIKGPRPSDGGLLCLPQDTRATSVCCFLL